MSTSAYTAPSGSYQTITSTAPRIERARPFLTLHTVGNLSGWLALIATVVLPLLWWGFSLDPLLRGMLLCAIAILALTKIQVAVSSRAAAEEGARTRAHLDRSTAAIARETGTISETVRCNSARLQRVSEIADLPDLLNDQMVKQARVFTAEVQQLRVEVVGRLVKLERAVEERDEEYERGWVDGAAKTADAMTSNGTVHQLRSGPDAPTRRR